MYMSGRQTLTRAELFKQSKYARVSFASRWLLLALRAYADIDGNVDLTMEDFWKIVDLSLEELRASDLNVWVDELIHHGHITPYVVKGRRYGSMVGWNDSNSPAHQTFTKKERENSKWRNPTPEDADQEKNDARSAVVQDHSGSSGTSNIRRGRRGEVPRVAVSRPQETTAGDRRTDVRHGLAKASHSAVEPRGTVDPKPTERSKVKKRPKASQTAKALGMDELLAKKRAMVASHTIAGPTLPKKTVDVDQWMEDNGIQPGDYEDAVQTAMAVITFAKPDGRDDQRIAEAKSLIQILEDKLGADS